MYGYVIFDWDDVLIKSIEPWLIAFDQTLAEYGLTLDREQKRAALTHFEMWLVKFGLPEGDLAPFVNKVKSTAFPMVENAPLYDGALELLAALKQNGVKLGVLSNASIDIRQILKKRGVLDYFEPYIISGRDVQMRKPHPEGAERLLASMKAVKAESVMVGNSATDLEAANAVGIDSILFNSEENSILNDLDDLMLQKPRYTVSNHAELARILLQKK